MLVISVQRCAAAFLVLLTSAILLLSLAPSDAAALADPHLSEEQAKRIASQQGGVPLALSNHPEMVIHASYSSRHDVWTISWSNPLNSRVVVEVRIDDATGRVRSSTIKPEAYEDYLPMMDEDEVISIAEGQEKVRDWLSDKGEISTSATLGDDRVWKVSFSSGEDIIAEVLINDDDASVDEIRIGPQVAWSMARGYEGAFGRIVNEAYIWLPLCALFLVPFVNIRRPLRLFHLDLLVLLSFSISHYYFNQGEIFVSVPLVYPTLVYLFLRLLWMGLRPRPRVLRVGLVDPVTGRPVLAQPIPPGDGREPVLHLNFSPRIMLAGLALLVVFRVALNIADSNVVDVGYSGVIGAQRIQEGVSPYGNMPDDNSNGDTYGPLNYLVYVPFERILPWSGEWDELAAAHATAIFFDLVAMAGMFFAGRTLAGGGRRGRKLGIALAFAWVAYPYTTFVMNSNVNDTIVAAFVIWGFALMRSMPLGALFLGFAAQIKFVPVLLAPLWSSFPKAFSGWGRRLLFVLIFLAALAAPLPVIFLGDGGLAIFWERSIAWQLGRDSPFSIWGQHADVLGTPQRIAQFILLGLSLGVYFWPPRKSLFNLAAASAALLIGFQLVQTHWFYLYIPWFFPLAMIAFAVSAGRATGRNNGRLVPTYKT